MAAALVLFAGGAIVGATVFGGAEVSSAGDGAPARAAGSRTSADRSPAAFTPGERGIYLQGAGLDTLPQDRVYELWVIKGDTPAAAVCVRPGEDGSVFAFADSQVAPDDLLAVTVEPSTCSEAPTTPPIWVAPVTST